MTNFIFIDTNIWIDLANNPKNFSQLSSLSRIIDSSGYRLVIPEFVEVEFKRNDTQSLESFKQKYQQDLSEAYRTFKNILLNQNISIKELDQLKQKAESTIGGLGKSLLTNSDIIKNIFKNAEKASTSHLMSEAANRCLHHIPPASSQRSSVGDCLLWFSVIEYLSKGDVYFCTRNTKDFSNKNRLDYLNQDLQNEAQSKSFSIKYFNDLNKLINSLLPQAETLPPFIVSLLPQFVCPRCHSDNYELYYIPTVGGMNGMGKCVDCNTRWRVIFEAITE